MSNTYNCPKCAEDCISTVELPAVSFQDCVDSVLLEESEICEVYMSKVDANGNPVSAPTDWTTAAAWATVLAQSGTGVRKLNVIGDYPEPEQEVVTISKRRKKILKTTHTVNADFDDMSDENYEFLRTLQCGGTVAIWFATIGGKLYGGAKGIRADVTKAFPALARGENTYALGTMQFQWNAGCSPERIDNPMAEA